MKLIERVNAHILGSLRSFVEGWLPDGKQEGNEWVARNPTRADAHHGSFKVNLNTCVWRDFASNEKGGNDPVSLYRYINGFSTMTEAAKELASWHRIPLSDDHVSNDPKPKRASEEKEWELIQPVPSDAPKPPDSFSRKEKDGWASYPISLRHAYPNAEGKLLGFTCRVDFPGGKKDVPPQTYWQNKKTGECKWRWKGFPEPRPLYGLWELGQRPGAPVLIVEGEKTADAAQQLVPWAVVLTWMGGTNAFAKADWSPLQGRRIAIWPDNDEPGLNAAIGWIDKHGVHHPGLAELLAPDAEAIKIIQPPSDKEKGWDLADALDEGWTEQGVKDWIRGNAKVYEAPQKQIVTEVPRGTSPRPPSAAEQAAIAAPMDAPLPEEPGAPIDPDAEPVPRRNSSPFFVRTQNGPRPDFYAMAYHLRRKFHFTCDESGNYIYRDGRYQELSEMGLAALILKETGDILKPSELDGFRNIAKVRWATENIFAQAPSGLINLRNGVLDVAKGELLPHSPDFKFRYRLDIDFDPEAKHPKWTEFLDTIFKSDEGLIVLALEVMAYILMGGDPFLQRAFCLYGEGRNGKSTFLNVLRAIIGAENCSSVPLKLLDKPFSVVSMDGKIANICEETPSDTINAEFFKNAVGGGHLIAAHKNKPEFPLKVRARFIFACNKFPVFKDNSQGMLDRLVFLPFTHYIEESKRDSSIDQKLNAELSGILNSIIPFAINLLESRRLTKPESSTEFHEAYREESCTVYAWMRDAIEVSGDPLDKEKSTSLYLEYKELVKEQGMHPVSQRNFTMTLLRYIREDCRKLGISPEKISSASRAFGRFQAQSINGIKLLDGRPRAGLHLLPWRT